jgi:glycosyltransferase involved in cell wall biosynthesis
MLVSVIIPVYNGESHLGKTISSVLAQSYPNFELLTIDDASTDRSEEVIRQFKDERIRYIRHPSNKGADAARNNGVRSSRGELLFLLDQDDYFHPDKIKVHVEHHQKHPEYGLTYNGRFELHHSAESIRGIWLQTQFIEPRDVILGFPISPSETVVQKKWIERAGMWDETQPFHGGEYIFLGRLAFEGCKFASVNRVLNYRRYHTGRRFRDIRKVCEAELLAQEKILSDSRCSPEVKALKNQAFSNSFLIWSYYAYAQNEVDLGNELLSEAVRLDPSKIEHILDELVIFFAENAIADFNLDHEELLKRIFLASPQPGLAEYLDFAVRYGYMMKGVSSITWENTQQGEMYFREAKARNLRLDRYLLRIIAHQLRNYYIEFGEESTEGVIRRLSPYFLELGDRRSIDFLQGCLNVNKAFFNFEVGNYDRVLPNAIKAVSHDRSYLVNKGVWAIALRSMRKNFLK